MGVSATWRMSWITSDCGPIIAVLAVSSFTMSHVPFGATMENTLHWAPKPQDFHVQHGRGRSLQLRKSTCRGASAAVIAAAERRSRGPQAGLWCRRALAALWIRSL